MAKNTVDTGILDKAIIFAVNAHSGISRKGNKLPYIVHPIEAVSIVASMTEDQELLAAAALHDVVEDTDATIEDILREFGKRVADLVDTETNSHRPGEPKRPWRETKQATLSRIAASSRESKMVAMGDKLSNMRAMRRDYLALGAKLWDRFKTKNPADHSWYYRGLAEALSELSDTEPYREFVRLVNEIFPEGKYGQIPPGSD